MAVSEYNLDTRIRRKHVALVTQQRRLRHLRSISIRNITLNCLKLSEFALSFSLHQNFNSPAFYTSEIITESLNPSWKDFESSNFPESVNTASSYVVVRIWNIKQKQLLIEWVVFFSGLVFLGEQIPKEGKNFKSNSVIFGMSEGYYGCEDCYQHSMPNMTEIEINDPASVDSPGLRISYTLNTLSRIKTVERAIKQTQAAVQKRRNMINDKLQITENLHKMHAKHELLTIKLSILKTELLSQLKHVSHLEKELSFLKEELNNERNDILKKSEDLKKEMDKWVSIGRNLSEIRESLLKTEAQLIFRRKQLISELSFIYPIVEFPDRKGFSIHDVHLPNSENFAGHDEIMISIALGYVCHIVLMISQFLNVPLRYSIHFYGSRSSIVDHISSTIPDKNREFPLYSKGKDRRFFEYGVFLLNKNIAQLRHLCGLATRDLSATLPNLSNLIELRLSISEPSPVLSNIGNMYNKTQKNEENKSSITENKINQNGVSHKLPLITPSQVGQVNNSEIEFLKKEMQEMMPIQLNQENSNFIDNINDTTNILSCSLDKGLNDIKLIEKSFETLSINKKRIKSSKQFKQLKEVYHHSSYPNLVSSFQGNDTSSVDSSTLLTIPPKPWAGHNSHANSEDEMLDNTKPMQQQIILNDSMFYIPSNLPGPSSMSSVYYEDSEASHHQKQIESMLIGDDFTADLAIRTEQLANRKSSFQMQRLRMSSHEEETLPRV